MIVINTFLNLWIVSDGVKPGSPPLVNTVYSSSCSSAYESLSSASSSSVGYPSFSYPCSNFPFANFFSILPVSSYAGYNQLHLGSNHPIPSGNHSQPSAPYSSSIPQKWPFTSGFPGLSSNKRASCISHSRNQVSLVSQAPRAFQKMFPNYRNQPLIWKDIFAHPLTRTSLRLN